MRAVFICFYYVPRAGGQDWAGIPQARLDSNGISKVGNRTDSAWRSGGSVRMVNKAFRRPAEFSGGFLFAPCRLMVARGRRGSRGVIDPIRLVGPRVLVGAIDPEGLRRCWPRAFAFFRFGKFAHRSRDAPLAVLVCGGALLTVPARCEGSACR